MTWRSQTPGGHLAERLGLAGHLLGLRQLLSGHALELLARVSEQIAEALIDAQPAAVEPDVDDPDRRRVEGRPVEALALDQIGRARAHLAFEHLAVAVVVVAVRLETQQVPHPHAELGAIDRLGEKVLGAGVEAAAARVCDRRAPSP